MPVFVLLIAGMAWGNRELLYEQLPVTRTAAEAVQGVLARYVPGVKFPGGRYGHLSLDPEELDLSPEFLAPTPLRSPGGPGAYEPLSDGGPGRQGGL